MVSDDLYNLRINYQWGLSNDFQMSVDVGFLEKNLLFSFSGLLGLSIGSANLRMSCYSKFVQK